MNFSESFPFKTTVKTVMSDLFTPVGIYLRLRDRFRDTILLESAGNQNTENNFSFIAVNAIAGIEIENRRSAEVKFPAGEPFSIDLENQKLTDVLQEFSDCFRSEPAAHPMAKYAQGLYGYISYDAVSFFEKIDIQQAENQIPLLRYRLYQVVIAINHYNDEMFIIENKFSGLKSPVLEIENLIHQKNAPVYPFKTIGAEQSNSSSEYFLEITEKAKQHCFRGDVFQLVLSRRFRIPFAGDEFNVYRSLRTINPSPYLFFFDYGDYKLIGSSPESQLIIKDNKAIIHPIAGTFRRTGDVAADLQAAEELKADAKENAEHTMLVDLARNDLSVFGNETHISKLKEVQFFSHVIHLVSEVCATLPTNQNPFEVIAATFPQGTLSGAPKHRAMQLIDKYEQVSRSFYGGAIGFTGFDGSCNMAIMIRTMLSKNNELIYQAGAGITAKSEAHNELKEVDNKLNALRAAIERAEKI
ncbi:anthranilate synthase component I family protein [Chryseobacterium salipaludis]|uniref:anthranilate synthase component I family protein n=1 Tax=Chryseobacterium TaxID=59732 RepID=UPI001FF6AB78|nr:MULTISPECIES: anthranilate synthase component I family protein [Chryseobacterium]MCJ8497968.1 anthranilate synthase component I family protein [Chryseobacterium salipaludis]MCX3296833.1 anthranilate synthase component I family protein [Planobacterium sp. JC490]